LATRSTTNFMMNGIPALAADSKAIATPSNNT
jgi:hypothetical protein